jgi:hypothetical protein
MHTKSSLLGGVALGVFLAASGVSAEAKPVKKKPQPSVSAEMQKQIDELREQVQFLKDRLDQQTVVNQQAQAQVQQAQAQADAAKAQAVASAQAAQAAQAQIIQTIPTAVQTAVAANKPKTDKLYYKGVSVTLGGFAEAAGIYRSRDETADISSSYSKIPFANDPTGRSPELAGTARQSRYSALVQGDIDPNTHAIFYGEFDFQGAAQTANSNQSDSYNPRIRNLYGEMDWDTNGWHLLAGQNWSLVTLNSKGITPRNEVPPPTIDAQYVPGFAWARQPQIRVTKDFLDHQLWIAVSAENPQTTFGNVAVASGAAVTDAQAPTNGYYNGTNYSLNKYPDLVAKVAYDSKVMDHTVHLEVFGLGRSFYDRVLLNASTAASNAAGIAVGNNDHTTYGGGVGGSVALNLIPKYADLQGSFLSGSGVGRYGSGGLPDVTSDATGALKAIPETMWLAGITLHPVSQVDFYVFGGGEYEGQRTQTIPGVATVFGYGNGAVSSNLGCVEPLQTTTASCSPLNKSLTQVTAGFWDRIYQGSFGRVQIGLQYSFTERDTFADLAGRAPKASDNMIFTSFRYYPF